MNFLVEYVIFLIYVAIWLKPRRHTSAGLPPYANNSALADKAMIPNNDPQGENELRVLQHSPRGIANLKSMKQLLKHIGVGPDFKIVIPGNNF